MNQASKQVILLKQERDGLKRELYWLLKSLQEKVWIHNSEVSGEEHTRAWGAQDLTLQTKKMAKKTW